jgi:predicted dehydrogenase/threonine dehydrogenase-like Zn-dependent dehydrogenase
MKQILQNLGNGETILAEVPCPLGGRGRVLSETTRTLVSLGTEKMLIDFGKGGLIAKARSQPDKVKQVLQKIKTDGLFTTIDAVRSKLDTPIPLGYCNVGSVLECDETNEGYKPGDRIISNGNHAEVVAVPNNLTALVPDTVTDEQAAFTVVGAIGLQGIRLLDPTLGERIVVSGLGLIGLMAVQMLKANGCQVLGIDFDSKKLELAQKFGAQTVDLSAGQDPVAIANDWTRGVGVDGVLITASTKSDELIHQAATMCRKRGRIVLVGVIGLNMQRADFYEKELSFQVSCSYGPGRYEDNYEKKGLDYPIEFVRWTEQRNFEAVLQLLADGRLDVDPLITHRFDFDNALDAYQAVSEPGAMGIVLNYGEPKGLNSSKLERVVENSNQDTKPPVASAPNNRNGSNTSTNSSSVGPIGIAFIGAGGFTTRMLMPLLPKHGLVRKSVVSSTGVSAAHAAKKFGFQNVCSDLESVLDDKSVDAVFITTPHNAHARMVCQALTAGKHVFVEKPLALTLKEMDQVEEAMASHPDQLMMIGFNRRFSPHMTAMKEWLSATVSSKSIVITVNAGAIPSAHWTQNPEVGGGRIVGEACHFIDLARFLAGCPITSSSVDTMTGGDGRLGDCVALQLGFEDGSIATVHYLANGSKDFPKERVEVFAGGKVLACDNFRVSKEVGGKRKLKTRGQDKGHAAELQAFKNAILSGGKWPISRDELLSVSRVSIELAEQVRNSCR